MGLNKAAVMKMMREVYQRLRFRHDPYSQENPFRILLLTNRDSDNTGDQVIEACDISLIRTIMKNIGIGSLHFKVKSCAAAIITKRYMATRDEALLERARGLISECDMIIFGGAPLFNYKYQMFYERTALTLELAQEYGKPVIFSAIGVEGYDEDDEKCQRLKKALNLPCVHQITTRDDIDSLMKFKAREDLVIRKVADPAVFANRRFENFNRNKSKVNRRVGIFVIRAHAFLDNGVDFDEHASAQMYVKLGEELYKRGIAYEFLTSGHFGDEAFLDRLIVQYGVSSARCRFGINKPEDLARRISGYDAVLTARLHPSIVSFSYGVPSLGLVWNNKVSYFYDSIGYPERIVEIRDGGVDVVAMADQLEAIMNEGVKKDPEFLCSVYESLFEGIKNVAMPNRRIKCFSYEKILRVMKPTIGVSEEEADLKLQRKSRRTYGTYNELFDKYEASKKEISRLKKELEGR
ncbi:MAG: polysaccharide pyruvyl transferase family protein [Lachnospiraceae bacterium]|nr:polysaccharide pyruvyl transferase family protein [Lachnospiraceae bacterium]